MALPASLKLPKERVHIQEARLLRRVAAFLADILFLDLFVFGQFSSLLPSATGFAELARNFTLTPALSAAATAMALLAFAYFALFEYLLAQTPGMMLLSLRTENVTLGRAFVRNLYLIPFFPFPLLWVLEPVHLLWRKTRLLELVSRTRTIEEIRY